VLLKKNSLLSGKASTDKQACGYRSCIPSQPMVTSIVLLPFCSVGYLEKLWYLLLSYIKQFLCSMHLLPGIVTSCGGAVYGFF